MFRYGILVRPVQPSGGNPKSRLERRGLYFLSRHSVLMACVLLFQAATSIGLSTALAARCFRAHFYEIFKAAHIILAAVALAALYGYENSATIASHLEFFNAFVFADPVPLDTSRLYSPACIGSGSGSALAFGLRTMSSGSCA